MSLFRGRIIGIEVFDQGTQMGISWEEAGGRRHAFRLDLPVPLQPDWNAIVEWNLQHKQYEQTNANPVGNGELEKGDRT